MQKTALMEPQSTEKPVRCTDFFNWANAYFGLRLNQFVYAPKAYADYQAIASTNLIPTQQIFKNALASWCQYHNYVLNPERLATQPNTILRGRTEYYFVSTLQTDMPCAVPNEVAERKKLNQFTLAFEPLHGTLVSELVQMVVDSNLLAHTCQLFGLFYADGHFMPRFKDNFNELIRDLRYLREVPAYICLPNGNMVPYTSTGIVSDGGLYEQ
jgi:hypothetical protein